MSGRDSHLIAKLKEGIQDAIVYLRMLEGAKLAPIYERKRKQVMQRLLELQGEGRKDVVAELDVPSLSSVDDQSVEEELASISTEESPARKRHSLISSGEDEEGSKIARRNSKLLGLLMSKFEQPDDNKTKFKYKTLEQLKNKQSEPQEDEEEEVEEEVLEEPAEVEELAEEDDEHPAATTEEVVEDKSRSKGRFGKFKKLFKSKDKDKPYAPVEVEPSSEAQEEQAGEKEGEEPEEEVKEVDSDIRLSAQLDRVTKRLGSTHHQRVYVTLRSTTLTVAKTIKGEDAREIALAGTSVSVKDSVHFEFHCDKKGLVFRTDCEEACQQWVEAMQAAITECSPEQPADKSSPQTSVDGNETVPQITVSVEPPEADNPPGSPAITSNIRDAVSTENLSKKKEKKKKATGPEMPSPAVITMKSYLYQKGTFSWDKKWCVFTADNTLYIANSETSQRPNTVLSITTDSKVQRKNGPDKCRHAVLLVSGGKKEQLGTDSETEFSSWIDLLEQAAGCAQIQELLSEDEDDGEFYEDLAGPSADIPVVPASPRPAHSFEPLAVPEEDDFDDDIYEAPDEVEIPKRSSIAVAAPSLPPRNDPKAPSPALPPRGAPAAARGPSLPSRHPISKITKAPAPAPPIDDEVYDDVVAQTEEMEETYDDVVAGGDGPEETYDDVMVQGGGIMEELYEELETDLPPPKPPAPAPVRAPVEEEQEEYTEMEMPGKTDLPVEDDDEFYVDVEQAPPARPPHVPTSTSTPAKSIPASTTAAKRGSSPSTPTKFTSSYTPAKQSSSPSTPSKLSSSFTPSKPSPPPTAHTGSPVAQRAATTGRGAKPPGAPGGASSKVASLSRMFGGASTEQPSRPGPPKPSTSSSSQPGSSHSGSLMYKSPTKKGYTTEWCVLKGYSLGFHSSQTDIVSHYKVSIRDMTLQLGTHEGRVSPFSFFLMRGATIHQFQASKKEDLVGWITALVSVVKEIAPSEGSVYVAIADRETKAAGQLSYKMKDTIWVVHRDSSSTWTGLRGKTPTSFSSTHGQFPAGDVQQYNEEDTYF